MTGRSVERLEEHVDQDVPQPPEVADRDGVLEPREGRLAGQVGIIGQPIGDELEDGVRPERVVVILVLVIGQDAVDPLPDHGQQRVPGESGVPPVIECGGELLGEADLLVELTKHQESGITGERRGGELELNRPRWEEIECRSGDRL